MRTLKEFFAGVGQKEGKTEPVALNDDDSLIHQHEQGNQDQPQTRYQCPMKCEGEKTYDQLGTCPVCNMKLAPVSM
jgi:hypothetical protein